MSACWSWVVLLLGLTLAPTDAPSTKPADLSGDLKKLQGEWSMVSGEREGDALPQAYVSTGKRVVHDDNLTVTIGGELFMKATITLDATKTPKTIDYAVTDGPNAGKKQLGIYELDGEKVKFCFSDPGRDRPAAFTTASGDGRTLSVWKLTKTP